MYLLWCEKLTIELISFLSLQLPNFANSLRYCSLALNGLSAFILLEEKFSNLFHGLLHFI